MQKIVKLSQIAIETKANQTDPPSCRYQAANSIRTHSRSNTLKTNFHHQEVLQAEKKLLRRAVKRWKPSAGRTQPRGKGTYLCMARADTREVGFHFSMDGALVGFVLIHKNASYSARFCAICRKTSYTTSGCKAEYIPYIFRNIYSVSLKAS